MLDNKIVLKNGMYTEQEIKAKIQELLSETPVDYGRIIALSNELAKFDNKNVRFTVDAGIITRLGDELVGKRETAVAELIKNSYDADATIVNVTFVNAWDAGGTLMIDDNGLGMNKEQLIDGFMRLSSADKIHHPISPIFKRTRAGRKGIGRFAAQRLGNILTIITQNKVSNNALKVTIHWNDFESDKYLSAIENTIEMIPKIKEQGTLLIIEDLKDSWSDSNVKKIYRSVSTLLQPYPLSQTVHSDEDPGFKSFFFRDVIDDDHKIVDEVSEITQFSLAVLDTYIDQYGQAHWSMKCDKFNYHQDSLIGKDPEDETSKMDYIRGVRARVYYFIYEASLLSGQKRNEIKAIAEEQGGIRLYRKGFRVLPYGEKGDDWIGLDQSARRRTIIAPHQNISFFGLVEIDNEGAEIFEETSSREGLIQNDAYEELVDFLYRAIIAMVLKVADLRGRKGSANQKEWKKKNSTIRVDAAIQDLRNIIENRQKTGSVPEDHDNSSSFYNQAKELIDTIVDARKDEKEEQQKLIDENNMLRVLAGTGLVIGEFIHEINRFEPAFSADIEVLRLGIKDDILQRKIHEMKYRLHSFKAYTAYFDRTISRNVVRELVPINVKEQVNAFYASIQNDLARAEIDMPEPCYIGIDLRTVPMHPSEWMSILFNLYTNAKKAVRDTEHKKMLIYSWRDIEKVYLEFSDNGKGIPEADKENIFNAFFTTSAPVGRGDDTNTGTGLGLTIIRDILTSYNGTIEVTKPANSYNTTFKISIPAYK